MALRQYEILIDLVPISRMRSRGEDDAGECLGRCVHERES